MRAKRWLALAAGKRRDRSGCGWGPGKPAALGAETKGGTPMGFLLLLPFFLVRFGLLARKNPAALARAAHFAPRQGWERGAYWVYQLATGGILLWPLACRIHLAPAGLLGAGAAVYLAGLALLAGAVAAFAQPGAEGFCQKGLYRYSRNPMYLAYAVFFTGCALLLGSPVLLGLVLLMQAAASGIIRAEERWCLQQFGAAYRQYMQRVRRYL